MTSVNFPDNPQVGDVFLNFVYDGEKWRNSGTRILSSKNLYEFSVAADDSTLRTISSGESIKFIGAGTVTTASDAEGNITITGNAPNLTGYATESYVTSRGYLTSIGTINYNDLVNKPVLFSGNYNELTNKPTVPTNTNQLTNGAGFLSTAVTSVLAGTGISLSASTGVVSITNSDPGSAQNIFKNIAVNGQSTIVADRNNDTLTFSAGSGISIATDSSNDVVTITNTITNTNQLINGAGFLTTVSTQILTDVDTATPSDGDVLIWNATAQKWQHTAFPSGAITLKGVWNAATNTPTLSSNQAGAQAGWEYIVNVAGTRNLGNGTITYSIGDLVLYDGTNWNMIPGSASVTSFNNRTGAVALSSLDVTQALGFSPYNSTNPNGYLTLSTLPAPFTFNVAADDSTLRTISREETIKFIGAGGITTSSDAEGAITITQGTTGSLINGNLSVTLNTDGTMTFPANRVDGGTNTIALWSSNQSSIVWRGTGGSGLPLQSVVQSREGLVNIGTTVGTTGSQTNYSWQFNTSGQMTFPDATVQETAWTGSTDQIVKVAGSFGVDQPFKAEVVADLTYGVTIETWTGLPAFATSNSWEFGYDGSMTFPDSSVQTTAYTGNAATVTNGVYTTDTGTVTNTMLAGSIANNKLANSSITVNGTSISLGSSGTVTAAAGTLTGTTLNSTVVSSSLTSVGTLTSLSSGAITTTGTLALNASGGITTNQTTFSLVNATATTVNFAGAATSLNMGASTGTTTINNNLSMASGKTIGTTATITSNASTAFVAGDNAISGVALQMPSEGALRNLTNGLSNMYFDISVGGSTNGQFQFRSSSSFTNVLTMSPTAFNVNPNAVVTARTPSFGRLPWNSAIDTELSIDDYRFRISNQGGIFPQVISNVTGQTKNSAWTVVAARSGSAITQTGSTGTLVPNNAWTTLYNSGGMDSAGDTYVATLQDKALGRIYRVTFMRSDNGSTTGYNIIAERLL